MAQRRFGVDLECDFFIPDCKRLMGISLSLLCVNDKECVDG